MVRDHPNGKLYYALGLHGDGQFCFIRVGIKEGEALELHDPTSEDYPAWLARVEGWGTSPEHRQRQFVITTKGQSDQEPIS